MHSFQPHHRFTVYKPAFQQDSEAFKYKKESELMLWEWPDFCEVSEWSLTLGGGGGRTENIKGKHSLTFVSDLFPEASQHQFWKISHHFSKTDKKSGKRKSYSSDKLRLTLLLSLQHRCDCSYALKQECANEATVILLALRIHAGIDDAKHRCYPVVKGNRLSSSL